MKPEISTLPQKIPVLIAGGGPVGLTLAALLSRYGVASAVIEADAAYCSGSRAICVSRRSQEILGWVGADAPLVAKGLPWIGGRSYFRDREILHFQMPSEPSERFAPMLNIQQFYIEEIAHRAAMTPRETGAPASVHWSTRVTEVRQLTDHEALVDVIDADGKSHIIRADYVVACDGGRSTVREQLGLQLQGTQYDGNYVIVDIVQKTRRAVERLAWFDPPSNPGSTILMHRQPDDVWRIDYQIADGEDPIEAVKPENVLPRVQSHLTMIGESEPWTPLWISIYNAKCLTLPGYRKGRVFFAGDAAHLVPIFGVRGLNSGLDDAGNLAWKLALVVQGRTENNARERLLDSYSRERVHAARENIACGAKSTEFMAPPDYGFRLLREAALRLASEDARVKSLINPRQTTPIEYLDSPLNCLDADADKFSAGARPGVPAAEAKLRGVDGEVHLTQLFGEAFVLLHFSESRTAPPAVLELTDFVHTHARACAVSPSHLRLVRVATQGEATAEVFIDVLGQCAARYGIKASADRGKTDAPGDTLYLIRPDGYVLARWADANASAANVRAALTAFLTHPRNPSRTPEQDPT